MFSHRVVGPTVHISDHHVRHRHDLPILGLLDEDGDAARNELTVKLDALRASNELPITVVTCKETDDGSLLYKYIILNNPSSTMFLRMIPHSGVLDDAFQCFFRGQTVR